MHSVAKVMTVRGTKGVAIRTGLTCRWVFCRQEALWKIKQKF